jgi:hypothetical protein
VPLDTWWGSALLLLFPVALPAAVACLGYAVASVSEVGTPPAAYRRFLVAVVLIFLGGSGFGPAGIVLLASLAVRSILVAAGADPALSDGVFWVLLALATLAFAAAALVVLWPLLRGSGDPAAAASGGSPASLPSGSARAHMAGGGAGSSRRRRSHAASRPSRPARGHSRG